MPSYKAFIKFEGTVHGLGVFLDNLVKSAKAGTTGAPKEDTQDSSPSGGESSSGEEKIEHMPF